MSRDFARLRSLNIAAVLCLVSSAFAASARPSAPAGPNVAWAQLNPSNPPSARLAPCMAYDAVSHKVVMFGGFDGNGYLNDTWTFDGKVWTKLTTRIAPPVRAAGSMAFDTVSQKLVLFGGYNGSKYLGDTWLFDGSTSLWSSTSPHSHPVSSTGPMLFTDPKNGHVDEFGGFDGRLYQLETWQWTGSTWHQLNPPDFPSARSSSVVSSDPTTNTVVLFSGLADVNPHNTWTWDGTDWTLQSPSNQPANRYAAGGAFHPAVSGVVAFGGGSGGVDLNDTWVWASGNWIQANAIQSPSPRESFGMAYDPVLGTIVIFGGLDGDQLLNDTWVLITAKSTY